VHPRQNPGYAYVWRSPCVPQNSSQIDAYGQDVQKHSWDQCVTRFITVQFTADSRRALYAVTPIKKSPDRELKEHPASSGMCTLHYTLHLTRCVFRKWNTNSRPVDIQVTASFELATANDSLYIIIIIIIIIVVVVRAFYADSSSAASSGVHILGRRKLRNKNLRGRGKNVTNVHL